jgi:hypothetical protein
MCLFRALLVLSALLNIIGAVAILLDVERVPRWPEYGFPLFGPEAVLYNATILLAVAVVYLYMAVSDEPYELGAWRRIAPFFLLHLYADISMGTGFNILLFALAFTYIYASWAAARRQNVHKNGPDDGDYASKSDPIPAGRDS